MAWRATQVLTRLQTVFRNTAITGCVFVQAHMNPLDSKHDVFVLSLSGSTRINVIHYSLLVQCRPDCPRSLVNQQQEQCFLLFFVCFNKRHSLVFMLILKVVVNLWQLNLRKAEQRRLQLHCFCLFVCLWVSVTQAGLHILRWHETIETQALVRPWGVGALASIADIWGLFTLIDIWGTKAEVRRGRIPVNVEHRFVERV